MESLYNSKHFDQVPTTCSRRVLSKAKTAYIDLTAQIHSLSGATLSLIRVCVESLERLRRLILYFSAARGIDYLPSKTVTIFVTRQDRNGKEGTGMYGLNGTL